MSEALNSIPYEIVITSSNFKVCSAKDAEDWPGTNGIVWLGEFTWCGEEFCSVMDVTEDTVHIQVIGDDGSWKFWETPASTEGEGC